MADLKYLNRLSRDYPNIKAASAEIINLKAILALPKGTEYFLSDLHGEHEAFIHMLKSASGTIKMKIDEHFEHVLSERERDMFRRKNSSSFQTPMKQSSIRKRGMRFKRFGKENVAVTIWVRSINTADFCTVPIVVQSCTLFEENQ